MAASRSTPPCCGHKRCVSAAHACAVAPCCPRAPLQRCARARSVHALSSSFGHMRTRLVPSCGSTQLHWRATPLALTLAAAAPCRSPSGAGFLLPFYLGVIEVLQRQLGIMKPEMAVAGSSAGSIAML